MTNDERPTVWQPGATKQMLALRARLLQQIRTFMAERSILEVETPILSSAGTTDPNIQSLSTWLELPDRGERDLLYLHTSPEFAMKRLLAADLGPIYQICKVFRNDESGMLHQPEFSMLEWYRPGFDHHQLMDELETLLQTLQFARCVRLSYAEVFQNNLGINPHTAQITVLQEFATARGLNTVTQDRSLLLDFLFSHSVAVTLGNEQPLFVYDYPACQAALARIRQAEQPLAERFELFISGIEISNGYNELCDSIEQNSRFKSDNLKRKRAGLAMIRTDEKLIAALQHGLPDCAGVAVGLDRLLMAISGSKAIQDVLAFLPGRA